MNTEPTRRISAANLTVPKKAPPPAGPFERLLRLSESLGDDKNDAVTVLIIACIGEGWNTDKLIVETLDRLGHSSGHVRTILSKGTGRYWRRNADKTYSPLP